MAFDTYCKSSDLLCLFCMHATAGTERNDESYFEDLRRRESLNTDVLLCRADTNIFLLPVRLYLDLIYTHPDFPSQAITVSQVSYRKLTCTVDHDSLRCLFTLQQHVSASRRCLLTSPLSCTPADPRGYRRVS